MHGMYQNLSYAFHCTAPRELSYMLHLHRQAELVYVTEGVLTLTVGSHEKDLTAGEAALVFPGIPHRFCSMPGSACIVLIFRSELAGGYARTLAGKEPLWPFVSATQLHPDVPLLLKSLCGEDPAVVDNNLVRGSLLVVLSRILGQMQLAPAKQESGSELLPRLLAYMAAHFTESISLDNLAEALGASKYHLSRLFSKRIGCGLNHYLNSLRFEYACELLHESTLPVTQVGFEAGFESLSTFYRLFKELAGVTPSEFRLSSRPL